MISTYCRSSCSRNSRQGFSLIEVAIALVIFVIGALAIIRIFPGALSVIGNNGDQQIATNLNRTTLAGLASTQTTKPAAAARVSFNAIPDATFNNSNINGTLSITSWTTPGNVNHSADFIDSNSSVIGVPRLNNTLPTPQEIEIGSTSSSLNRYRAILGERAEMINLTVGASANKYALTQFPVSVQSQGTPAVLLPVKPVISQDYILNDVRTTPDGTLDFSRYRLDDSNDITTTSGVNAGSVIYVSYRYYNSGGKVWGIREESLPLTATNLRTTTTVKVKPPTGTGLRDAARVNGGGVVVDAVIPEIVQVKLRSFVGQGEFGATGATPLEQVADARRGLVRLPATGIDDTKPVMLDYIADWSFLLQDGTPSTSPLITPDSGYPALPTTPAGLSYRQLALGTPFIEDRVAASVYSLLIESGRAYSSAYGDGSAAPDVTPDPPAADRMVRPTQQQQRDEELRFGKVTFIIENSAASARVAYQTRANWVQQLSVAAQNYKPFGSGQTERWRDYYLGNDNYLYFHAGEAGKTISISYSYNDVTDDVAATPLPDKSIVDRPFAIDSQLIDAPSALVTANFVTAGSQVARVKLQTAQGEDFPATKRGVAINLTSIQAVRGTSITSRTAYINGTKYAQTLNTTTRGASS